MLNKPYNTVNNIFNHDDKNKLFLNQVKSYLLYDSEMTEIYFDTEDFSVLLTALLILVNEYGNTVNFKVSKKNKIEMNIKRDMDFTDFQLFVKLFEELTLKRLLFYEKDNEWTCNL